MAAPAQDTVTTLGDALREGRESAGSVTFHLDDGVRRLDVSELYETAFAQAAILRARGVGRGDRVGLLGHNRPEWVGWAWATWLTGAALVPLPAPVLRPSRGKRHSALCANRRWPAARA